MLDRMNDSFGGVRYGNAKDRLRHVVQGPNFSQRTLKNSVPCVGVGLHSGKRISMTLKPAKAGHGIVFKRTDVDGDKALIPARYDLVTDTRMCTKLTNEHGVCVGTVEHVMSALSGLGIDNVLIEVSGPEVPVKDGSSEPFVFMIECAGTIVQNAPRRYLKILEPIEVNIGEAWARLEPAHNFSVAFDIDFAAQAIGKQSLYLEVTPKHYKRDLCSARTFGFFEEVEAMRKAGLARGGSLENAVVIQGDKVMNEEGLRFEDEFVRHKTLDAIGDLALAQAPILGHYHGMKAGHHLNNELLRAVFASPQSFQIKPLQEAGLAVFPNKVLRS